MTTKQTKTAGKRPNRTREETGEKEKRGRNAGKTGPRGTRPAAYARRRAAHPAEPPTASLRAVGYPESARPCIVESTAAYKAEARSIAARRERMQAREGYTFEDVAQGLYNIATDTATVTTPGRYGDKVEPATQASAKVAAYREISSMMGYKAPDQVEVTQRGLVIELSGMSNEEIRRALESMQ